MSIRKIFVEAKELLPIDKKESAIKKITELSRNNDGVYILAANDDNQEQIGTLINIFKEKYVKNSILNYETAEDVPRLIKEIVHAEESEYEHRQRGDKVRFLVIASGQIKNLMWTHTIRESLYHAGFVKKADYVLCHEFWCENPRIEYSRVSDREIEKVVFLDIDGVLNIENRNSKDFVLINEEFVKNLALITHTTKAEVVITSSWRYGLNSDYYNMEPKMGEAVKLLTGLFEKYNIPVLGMTPLHFNGPDGRPFEIRQWLVDKADVKNFVILDDETFWQWNWLQKNVVCTSQIDFDDDGRIITKCGLTRELALEAIKILNSN